MGRRSAVGLFACALVACGGVAEDGRNSSSASGGGSGGTAAGDASQSSPRRQERIPPSGGATSISAGGALSASTGGAAGTPITPQDGGLAPAGGVCPRPACSPGDATIASHS